MSKTLLIVEDDHAASVEFSDYFKRKEWHVETASDIKSARSWIFEKALEPDVILADLGLPDGNILDHLEEVSEALDNTEWVFAVDDENESLGDVVDELAYDFIEKPYDKKSVEIAVNRALRATVTLRRLKSHSKAVSKQYGVEAYFGSSDKVKALRELLKKLSHVPISTMIITGETGTGKGLVARIIHHSGMRKDGPIVEQNCAALPKDLLESELFGHEAGAFTGAKGRHRGLLEQANGGTLFLDEIGDMDLDLQAKLLKAIEDKTMRRLGGEKEVPIDVQILAATGKNLAAAVSDKTFREDLYHRLSVFRVELPPLRERKTDLVELVPQIIAEYNAKANKKIEVVPDDVWEKLLAYDWPGNVRELRNVIERCVLLSTGEDFPAEWMQLPSQGSLSVDRSETPSDGSEKLVIPLDGSMALDEMDSFIIQSALELNDYNITETARVLGATRETLRYRIQKYHLKTEK